MRCAPPFLSFLAPLPYAGPEKKLTSDNCCIALSSVRAVVHSYVPPALHCPAHNHQATSPPHTLCTPHEKQEAGGAEPIKYPLGGRTCAVRANRWGMVGPVSCQRRAGSVAVRGRAVACAVPQGGQKERRLQVYVGLLDLCYYFHEFGYYFEFNLTLLLILSLFLSTGLSIRLVK